MLSLCCVIPASPLLIKIVIDPRKLVSEGTWSIATVAGKIWLEDNESAPSTLIVKGMLGVILSILWAASRDLTPDSLRTISSKKEIAH